MLIVNRQTRRCNRLTDTIHYLATNADSSWLHAIGNLHVFACYQLSTWIRFFDIIFGQINYKSFRTDSETTDDQCIPESTSEPHDSALDSMDDFIDEENIRISVNKKAEKEGDFAPKVPQICLLEVQSSTESDKTVLSTTTVFEQQLRAMNSDCSLPSSPGLICATTGKKLARFKQ